MEKWINEMRCKKPNSQFLICGDFNTSDQPIEHWYRLTEKDKPTYQREVQGKLR